MHQTASQSLVVGFFGIAGSFTHRAATLYFDADAAEFAPKPSFASIFQAVSSGKCTYGVVPIENTLAGSVYENYDLLEASPLTIIGELTIRVSHNLLVSKELRSVPTDKRLRMITEVHSHQKALEQCSVFLEQHDWMVPHGDTDTAKAALYVSEQHNPAIAAIGSEYAAARYGLDVLEQGIENNRYNFTRFLIVGRERADAPANKCSVVAQLSHTTGSLNHVLQMLASHNNNLTKIESRPVQDNPFEYAFYIDFTFGDHKELEVTIEALRQITVSLRILGIYQSSTQKD